MGQVSLTTLANGTVADADQVMSDLFAIVNEVNGNLSALTNVQVASAGTITGYQNTTGNSASLAAADHQHIVQGVERTTGDPAFGNFDGRVFFNTSTAKLRMVSDSSGPTFKTVGNLSGDELVAHAANHTDGGVDELPDNAIAERSLKSKSILVGQIPSNVGPISNGGFTTVQDLIVSTTGVQTLLIIASLRPTNAAGSRCTFYWRVRDVTNANTTIYRSNVTRLDSTSGGNDETEVGAAFLYTVPAAGTRTLRLGAGADNASVTVSAVGSAGGDATTAVTPNLQAVIL